MTQPDWLARLALQLHAELIETPISWVLLGPERAWKFKKPVKLPFLDYSTPALRLACCNAELALNQRFSSDLYLGVDYPLGAPEPAVVMRRFPAAAQLDQACARGTLTPDALGGLVRHIHACHQAAGGTPPSSEFGHPDQILSLALDNFAPLRTPTLGLPPEPRHALDALEAWTRSTHTRLRPCLETRWQDGHIRECHGDLHLGNLILENGEIRPFDCIEFNPGLRWIDTASELAFTWMDLLDHQAGGLGGWLLNEWLEHSGDFAALPLLRFYGVYKALVRAKVAALGQDRDRAARYLALAGQIAWPAAPTLCITHGLSGSGKSTRARAWVLADPAGSTLRLRSDVERKRLFGLGALEPSRPEGMPAEAGASIYTREAGVRTYARLAELARQMLAEGWSVVVDAAFLKAAERQQFADLARSAGANFRIMACTAPEAELARRLEARQNDPSEATPAIMRQQHAWLEPLDAREQAYCVAPG